MTGKMVFIVEMAFGTSWECMGVFSSMEKIPQWIKDDVEEEEWRIRDVRVDSKKYGGLHD